MVKLNCSAFVTKNGTDMQNQVTSQFYLLNIRKVCANTISNDLTWPFSKGGLAEEVDEGVIRAAFIPFGEISEVQLPIDYQTEKHRGFAFVDFELPEDAKAAIDNMVSLR